MDYKKDFNIKPKHVETDGTVLFTDGTNDVIPNQLSCEAYGYNYDNETGTCTSFIRNRNLDVDFSNITNKVQGENNKIQEGVHNTSVIGRNNTVYGENENCLISGQGNTINNGINNATVTGAYGKAIRQGEFVRGGGGSSKVNETQSSVINLTCNTTDNTATNMKVQGLDDTYINVQNNSILGFEVYLTRLEIGGASGNAGNFSYRAMKGVVRIADDYTTTIITFNSRVLGKDGVNGTVAIIDVATGTITIQVTDRAAVNNIWNATVYLHETKTNIAIS